MLPLKATYEWKGLVRYLVWEVLRILFSLKHEGVEDECAEGSWNTNVPRSFSTGRIISNVVFSAENPPTRLYEFIVRYDNATGEQQDQLRVLSFRMFGPLADTRVWAALRWGASAMIGVSREWRGVLWEGWPECVEDHKKVYLVTPEKVQ